MSQDTLSDLLRAVRLRGAVFYHVDGVAPWVAETPHAREIIPGVMPGAEHLIEFHGIMRGTCWAAITGEAPVRLEEGDLILFPQGDAHVLSSAPGMRAASAETERESFFAPRPPQLPFAYTISNAPDPDGGDAERVLVVCGFLGLDARPFNPLLAALPRVLRIPCRALGPGSWVWALLEAVVAESSAKRPGGEAVLERMSEMLFVEALRRHVETLPPEQTGWLAGMRDPVVGRALALMHEKPEADWTVERLGEGAGLSRSSLHERFVHFIGQPPMQYLAHWRMQVAAKALRDTDATLVEVALGVGYESEAAFSRAFKRVAGTSPGAWRRARRGETGMTSPRPRATLPGLAARSIPRNGDPRNRNERTTT